jgi:hypothetical protein
MRSKQTVIDTSDRHVAGEKSEAVTMNLLVQADLLE